MGISFIIPAFNEEKYIGVCIRCIKAEMMENKDIPYEIIVVDNNCTDGTHGKAVQMGAKVVNESRPGVVWARQAGAKTAKYEYLAFVDADSLVPWGWAKQALKSFKDNNVVAVSGPLQYFDVSTSLRYAVIGFYYVAEAFHHLVFPMVQGGNVIIRKVAYDQMNGFDTSVPFWGEDTMTAVRLSKIGKVAYDRKMYIRSSGRRLLQDGVIKTSFLYTINYLSINILGRPINKKYKNFR